MIDVSDIINDPDFNVLFTRIPVTGSFVTDGSDNDGDWVVAEGETDNMSGIILPSKMDELKVLPEGERNNAAISIYSLTELNMGEDQDTTQSDIIGYNGGFYRVAWVRFYIQCQVWYAVATRYQRVT